MFDFISQSINLLFVHGTWPCHHCQFVMEMECDRSCWTVHFYDKIHYRPRHNNIVL